MSILFYSLGFSLTCKHHGRKVEKGAQEEARRREEEEEARRREEEEEEARRREKGGGRGSEEKREGKRGRREKGGRRGSEEKREGKRGKSRVHADGRIEEENPIFCTDMAATWLPRPVSCCRGVHVAVSKLWGEKRTKPKQGFQTITAFLPTAFSARSSLSLSVIFFFFVIDRQKHPAPVRCLGLMPDGPERRAPHCRQTCRDCRSS